ncbi:MAG: hypothetical protein Kow0075_00210 [Salibacteraceae bacterium]
MRYFDITLTNGKEKIRTRYVPQLDHFRSSLTEKDEKRIEKSKSVFIGSVELNFIHMTEDSDLLLILTEKPNNLASENERGVTNVAIIKVDLNGNVKWHKVYEQRMHHTDMYADNYQNDVYLSHLHKSEWFGVLGSSWNSQAILLINDDGELEWLCNVETDPQHHMYPGKVVLYGGYAYVLSSTMQVSVGIMSVPLQTKIGRIKITK